MRTRPPVEDITHDVKMIDDQTLYQVAQRNYKIRRPPDTYYCMYYLVIICFLILNFGLLGNKFLNYIGEVLGKSFSYFRSCVF